VSLYVFMIAWNEFLLAFMLLDDPSKFTLTRGVAMLNSSEIPRQHLMAGAVIATVPVMALFLGLEKFMTRADRRAVKGWRDGHRPAGQRGPRDPAGNDRGGYTIPTAGLYPYQWNWDSAPLPRWGFATFDIARAWTELETLLSGQWDDGMVPHILFHRPDPGYFPGPDVWGRARPDPATSGISQPPVAATLARLLSATRGGARPGARALSQASGLAPLVHDLSLRGRPALSPIPGNRAATTAPTGMGRWPMIDPVGVGALHAAATPTMWMPRCGRPKADYDRYLVAGAVRPRLGWDQAEIVAKRPVSRGRSGDDLHPAAAQRDLAALGRRLARMRRDRGWIATLEAGAEALWNPDLAAFDARDLRTGAFAGALGQRRRSCAGMAGSTEPGMRAASGGVGRPAAMACPASIPGRRFEAARYWRGPSGR
jgi:hypothetical protein